MNTNTDSDLDLLESAAGEEDPGAGVEVIAPPTAVQPMVPGGVDECPECSGTGRLGNVECPECGGTGLVTADVSGV